MILVDMHLVSRLQLQKMSKYGFQMIFQTDFNEIVDIVTYPVGIDFVKVTVD